VDSTPGCRGPGPELRDSYERYYAETLSVARTVVSSPGLGVLPTDVVNAADRGSASE
jgi:hypothetical protein